MVICSVVLLSFGFILQRIYQKGTDEGVLSSIRFSIYSACFSLVILLLMNGLKLEFSWYSLINAAFRAACGFAYTVIGFWIMKRGGVALYMLFLMSGGMILPAVWGWLLLDEAVLPLRVLGVLVILAAIFVTQLGGKRPDIKMLAACLCVFILNGFVSVSSKLHQINETYPTVSTEAYALFGTVLSLIMSLLMLAVLRRTKGKHDLDGAPKDAGNQKRGRASWSILIVAGYSVLGCISSLLQLWGAKSLPASVLYPLITGGSTVFGGLFAAAFLGERQSRREWIGIALCVVGTLLFL